MEGIYHISCQSPKFDGAILNAAGSSQSAQYCRQKEAKVTSKKNINTGKKMWFGKCPFEGPTYPGAQRFDRRNFRLNLQETIDSNYLSPNANSSEGPLQGPTLCHFNSKNP